MASQSWLDGSIVDRPRWEHWLSIAVPDNAHRHRAMLYINGGRNEGGEAPDPDMLLVQMALSTGSSVAQVGQVPNDPLRFADESDER